MTDSLESPDSTAHETSVSRPKIPERWKSIVVAVWSGQAVSILTSYAASYAAIWYLTESTGSAIILSLAAMAGFLPQGLLGPFAGTIVDRFNRKHIMIIADLGIALSTIVLAIMIAMGFLSVPFILGMLALRSVGTAFHSPAMQAVIPLLVPDRHLVRIASLDQAIVSIAAIAGPALGIFVYSAFGLQVALFADAVGALIACGILALVAIPDVHMEKADRTGVVAEMLDGFRAIKACRGLLPLFAFVTLGFICFIPISALFPLMTYEHFGGGGFEASLVEAAFGVGLLIGSIALGIWGGGNKLVLLVVISAIATGFISLLCGLLPPSAFMVFVGLSFAMAIAGAFFNGPLMAIIQRRIVPEKLGRVMALFGSVMALASPIGLAVAGPVAEQIGVAPWFVLCGIALMITCGAAYLVPSVRSLDAFDGRSL